MDNTIDGIPKWYQSELDQPPSFKVDDPSDPASDPETPLALDQDITTFQPPLSGGPKLYLYPSNLTWALKMMNITPNLDPTKGKTDVFVPAIMEIPEDESTTTVQFVGQKTP
eukprot:Selendium_serpulae@DN6093_c2_g1_i11.p3